MFGNHFLPPWYHICQEQYFLVFVRQYWPKVLLLDCVLSGRASRSSRFSCLVWQSSFSTTDVMSFVFVFFYISISAQRIFSLNRFCCWKSGFVATRWVPSWVKCVGTVLSNVGHDTRLTVGTCGYWWYGPWILWHLRRCC